MLTSSQDVITLCAQHWEIVCIPAQDVCLVLDPSRYVLLKEHRALGDDRVRQLNGHPVQQHNVDRRCSEGLRELMGKGGL